MLFNAYFDSKQTLLLVLIVIYTFEYEENAYRM
jgi:hypothetical protein